MGRLGRRAGTAVATGEFANAFTAPEAVALRSYDLWKQSLVCPAGERMGVIWSGYPGKVR